MKVTIKPFSIKYQGIFYFLQAYFKKCLWFLARDAFLFILVLVLVAIVFGEIMIYNYIIKVDSSNLDVSVLKFKKDTYDSVVKESEKRDRLFNNLESKVFKSPFKE